MALIGLSGGTAASSLAALTENATTVGGTNDGDLPALTATAATITEDETTLGGTNNGDIPALAMSVTWNGTDVFPSAADAALIIAAIRECAAMVNAVVADNVALRAAIREVATKVNAIR